MADDPEKRPDAICHQNESRNELRNLIAQLPPDEANVLIHYYFKDWTMLRIARSIGKTESPCLTDSRQSRGAPPRPPRPSCPRTHDPPALTAPFLLRRKQNRVPNENGCPILALIWLGWGFRLFEQTKMPRPHRNRGKNYMPRYALRELDARFATSFCLRSPAATSERLRCSRAALISA